MQTNLKDYFPNIRTRDAVLEDIQQNIALKTIFDSWKPGEQKLFLDYCTGARGLKILYDPYFKEIMNPEYAPERLERLLSLILGEQVHICQILPNDSTRLADEGSLLVTDIIVEFADGRIANVEVQKIGYYFPGERTACYISDLMLRQYRRIRSESNNKFSYRDIREVYTIIFYESSPAEFSQFPDIYVHHGQNTFDSGLPFHIPMQIYMIPLDIFRKSFYNNGIRSPLDAWLAFLSFDTPEQIIHLIQEYPEFRPIYQNIYDICENAERMVTMFSKELALMDQNTVQLMIDDLMEQVKDKQAALAKMDSALAEKNAALAEKDSALAEKDASIESLTRQIAEMADTIRTLQAKIRSNRT